MPLAGYNPAVAGKEFDPAAALTAETLGVVPGAEMRPTEDAAR